MTQNTIRRQSLSRRRVLAGSAGVVGAAALRFGTAHGQQNANLGTPASVVTNPPREWEPA